MDAGSSYFIHQCGLKQRNIVNNDGYCALFIVNTPAFDDSGVGHAVEHFVFRRSKTFNEASTLFQLTSLTDLTINASTCSRVTYFHCQCQCQETFELGLRYLLSGLIKPLFCDSDLKDEIHDGANCGVIYRELSGSQLDVIARRQAQIDISDTSAERTHQYGGDSRFISKITTDDLKKYHAQHYHPKAITLVTANVSTSLVSTLLEPIIFDNCGETTVEPQQKYRPRQQQRPHQFERGKLLARWWLNPLYFGYFECHYSTITSLLLSINAELTPPQLNLNKNGQFALNVIVNEKNTEIISAVLKQFIVDNPPTKYSTAVTLEKLHDSKYSPEINRLLEVYDANQSELALPSRLTIGVPTLHRLTAVEHQYIPENIVKQTLLKPVSQRLHEPLVELSHKIKQMKPPQSYSTNNKQRTSAIPKLLNSLYLKAVVQLGDVVDRRNVNDAVCLGVSVAFDLNHCVMVTQLASKNSVLAVLASYIIGAYPPFLAPRIQGHCYLVAVKYLEASDHLVVFSALDVSPAIRLDTINQSIFLLSQDVKFITESLTLAKIKLSGYYPQLFSEASEISPSTLVKFLHEQSEKTISEINHCCR
ncbi:MAG: insulinase family protein [Colwellia sp.]|nr:insulinase family protein [Colwellia sp.]